MSFCLLFLQGPFTLMMMTRKKSSEGKKKSTKQKRTLNFPDRVLQPQAAGEGCSRTIRGISGYLFCRLIMNVINKSECLAPNLSAHFCQVDADKWLLKPKQVPLSLSLSKSWPSINLLPIRWLNHTRIMHPITHPFLISLHNSSVHSCFELCKSWALVLRIHNFICFIFAIAILHRAFHESSLPRRQIWVTDSKFEMPLASKLLWTF